MKKVIEDNLGFPLGWMETKEKKGTTVEVVDSGNFAHTGIVAESLAISDRCFEGISTSGYPENNKLTE